MSAPASKLLESVPVHRPDNERGVICCALAGAPDAAFACDEADFYLPRNRLLFSELKRIYQAHGTLDELFVAAEMVRAGTLERIGDKYDLGKFYGDAVLHMDGTAAAQHVRRVQEAAAIRKSEEAAKRFLTRVSGAEAGKALLELRSALESVPVQSQGPEDVADWLKDESFTRTSERVATGFVDLDRRLQGGFVAGALYVLAGITSTGKTTLASNLALSMTLQGTPVLLDTLEDTPAHVCRKLVAATARIPVRSIESRAFCEGEAAAFMAGVQTLKALPLQIISEARLDVFCGIVAAKARAGCKLVILDQLSHLQVPGAKDQFQRAADASRALQRVAKESGCAVLALCQINRAGCKAEAGPTLFDLRDSGTIEADARGVLLIKKLTRTDGDLERGVMTLEIAKHTFGPRDVDLKLTVFLSQQRIENYFPEHQTGERK